MRLAPSVAEPFPRPVCWLAVLAVGVSIASVRADVPVALGIAGKAQISIDKALHYLTTTQHAEGGWIAFDQPHMAVTSLVVQCLAQDAAHGCNHPATKRGIEYVLRFVQPDGGIYAPGQGMKNYHTSVALMALAACKNPLHTEKIRRAQRFLKDLMWDSGEGHERSSTWFGGAGYGKHKRPDLSNTQMMLEALRQSGLASDDPVYKKALVFIGRCQMLGKLNDQLFAAESVEGGFIYTPVGGGESKAGLDMKDGKPRLRSYGSMTYAGFKSMLYAKVDRNDPRVQSCLDWIRRHYTLDHNPNMPHAQSQEGVYYYYHVFARALHAWGEPVIVDAQGVPHRWRDELFEKLISLQREGGHWVNDEDRWYQGNPHLVTAFSILALQTALEQP